LAEPAVSEWGEVFGDPVVATALLDRLLFTTLWSSRLKHQATGCAGQADPDACLL
jgi:IstB-like ATP binding protein